MSNQIGNKEWKRNVNGKIDICLTCRKLQTIRNDRAMNHQIQSKEIQSPLELEA